MRISMPQAIAAGAAALVVALLTACGGDPKYTQISAGSYHTCGLRSDGSVICWGSDEYGQSRVPPDERFTAVAAGSAHTCGLRTDGTTICWGYRLPGGGYVSDLSGPNHRPPFPPEDERLTAIVLGVRYTCGLRTDGGAVCWNTRSDFSPFGTEEIVEIISGGGHICGLRPDGSVLCNDWLAPPEGDRFAAISMSGIHACGLRSDGGALCWGLNEAGQVTSVENGSYIADPVSPPEEGPFSAMATGIHHTCGLRSDETVVCWGYDLENMARIDGADVGVNAPGREFLFNTRRSEPPEGERFTAISAGSLHTCGLRQDGGVSCWGYNNHGQASPPGN